MCPNGYHLELHAEQAHGNICRSDETTDFVCPRCCGSVHGPPYCTGKDGGPCQSDALDACSVDPAEVKLIDKKEEEDTEPLWQAELASPWCPSSSTVESHAGNPTHGDICRDTSKNFVCPRCCVATERGSTPYCFAGEVDNSSFQVTGRLILKPLRAPTHASSSSQVKSALQPCRTTDHACAEVSSATEFAVPGEMPEVRAVKWTLSIVLRTWEGDAAIGTNPPTLALALLLCQT